MSDSKLTSDLAKIEGSDAGVGETAQRYVVALCDLAQSQNALSVIATEVERLASCFVLVPEFAALVRNPTMSMVDQEKTLNSLVKELPLGDLMRRFVSVLIHNKRLQILPDVILAFRKEASRRGGEQLVRVTSSDPLTDKQVSEITKVLTTKFGKGLKLVLLVDKKLIGGITVEIGTKLIDFSIQSKLTRLEQVMKGAE